MLVIRQTGIHTSYRRYVVEKVHFLLINNVSYRSILRLGALSHGLVILLGTSSNFQTIAGNFLRARNHNLTQRLFA